MTGPTWPDTDCARLARALGCVDLQETTAPVHVHEVYQGRHRVPHGIPPGARAAAGTPWAAPLPAGLPLYLDAQPGLAWTFQRSFQLDTSTTNALRLQPLDAWVCVLFRAPLDAWAAAGIQWPDGAPAAPARPPLHLPPMVAA